MKQLKGISPLVATILLIAFTLIVAGILAGWATQFASSKQQQINQCLDAMLYIQRASYDSATDDLSIVVYNAGKVDLNFFLLLSYANATTHPNLVERSNETYNITSGTIKTVKLLNVTGDLDEITVKSDTCQGVQNLLTKAYIQGL